MKRALGDVVEVTIDGKLVSWTNEYGGSAKATTDPSSPGPPLLQQKVAAKPTKTKDLKNQSSSSRYNAASQSTTTSKDSGATSGSWTRQAYYDAAEGTTDGLTFLNHFGGTKGIPGTAAGGPA